MDRERAVSIRTAAGAARAPLSKAGSALAAVLLWACVAQAATVSNTAQLDYVLPTGGPVQQFSNTVTLETESGPTPGTVTLFRYAPGSGSAQPTQADGAQCGDGAGGFTVAPPVARMGSPIDLSSPAPLLDTTSYHAGEPVFVTLADWNRNSDPLVRDTIDLRFTTSGGDTELLRLRETGPDTGLFAGAIQSVRIPPPVASYDCRLSLPENTMVTTDYVDATDSSDTPIRI